MSSEASTPLRLPDAAAAPAASTIPAPLTSSTHHVETVLWVRHWTDSYFSFAITRPQSFRFRSGEFVMIGLPGEDGGRPVMRAYSIASPAWAEELEFFSIKVPGGPLTSRLRDIKAGDQILLGRKPTGTLVLDAVRPGKRLFLLGTGTGLAPWLSIIREPDTYERFEQVIVSHGVRQTDDLAYRAYLERELREDEILGELIGDKLIYLPTVSRDAFDRKGRITDHIENGSLFREIGLDRDHFSPEEDRIMLCGSMDMIRDLSKRLEAQGMTEGSNADPGDFVIERAFVG